MSLSITSSQSSPHWPSPTSTRTLALFYPLSTYPDCFSESHQFDPRSRRHGRRVYRLNNAEHHGPARVQVPEIVAPGGPRVDDTFRRGLQLRARFNWPAVKEIHELHIRQQREELLRGGDLELEELEIELKPFRRLLLLYRLK